MNVAISPAGSFSLPNGKVSTRQRLKILGLFALSAVLAAGPVSSQTLFEDVSGAAGVGNATESFGAAWGDLNGDGYLDIFVNNHRHQSDIFLNRGNGTFASTSDQVQAWVNRPSADTHGGTWADFDNDGDQDLLITTGTGNPNQFLVNDAGALIDKAPELGVGFQNLGGRLPVWFDYNNDGLLDIVITQLGGIARLFTQTAAGFVEDTDTANLLCVRFQYGQLYDVDGNGRLDFVCQDDAVFPQKIYDTLPLPWADLTSLFPTISQVPDSIIGDFDNDQRLDMFVISNVTLRPTTMLLVDDHTIEANITGMLEKGFSFTSNGSITINLDWNKIDEGFGLSQILIGTNGANPFSVPFTLDPADPTTHGVPPSDPAAAPIIRIGYDTTTQRWTIIHQPEDFFSEAYFIITTDQPASDLQATGLGSGDTTGSPTLISNLSGGFADTTAAAGLDAPVQCASVTAGDFDNDTDLDLYLACRTGAENLENIYYDNQGDGTFVAVPSAGGAPGPIGSNVTSGAGTADTVIAADYDLDGFLDLFITNGLGLRPKDFGGPNKLYRNIGNGNHWIQLDLVGTTGSREPMGAQVRATAAGVTQLRVYDGGYHRWSQEARRMHFGLAGATTVDLTVTWPNGSVEQFAGVAADHLYTITQGGGIQQTVPETNKPYSCGAPTYDPATEGGVFIWRDCTLDEWRVRFASGGPWTKYIGQLVSDGGYAAVEAFSLESSDVLDNTTDPLKIAFDAGMSGSGQDGFNLTLNAGSNACFELSAPAGAAVYYGQFKTPLSAPFDLKTGGACVNNLPELSISNAVAGEASGQMDFTLSLSAVAAGTVTVDVSSTDGSAVAGEDYVALAPTTFTFAPGETSKIVSVPILDDALGENDETFSLALSNASGATLALSGGTGTILDDEVSSCDEPVFDAATEAGVFIWQNCDTGDWQVRMTSGGSPTTFTYSGSLVSNSPYAQVTPFSNEVSDVLDATTDPLRIAYSMSMLNAGVDGFDFVPAAGASLCFELDGAPAGTSVYVGKGRSVAQPPFDPVTLGACGGLPPELNVAGVAASETAGQVDVTVTLSAGTSATVTVDVETQDGTAVAGLDYTAQPLATLTFNPGETSKTVSIPLLDDNLAEGDEAFALHLSNASNATIGTTDGTVTILDDEVSPCGEPAIDAATEAGVFVWRDCTTDDWHMRVTGGGVFTVYSGRIVSTANYAQVTGFSIESTDTLDTATDPLQIAYELQVSGGGQDGVDFLPGAGASTCFEVDQPAGAAVFAGQAKTPMAGAFDLDTLGACGGLLPEVSIADVTVDENSGQVDVAVSLSVAGDQPVTVELATADGLAVAGSDYVAHTSTLTIDPGQLGTLVTLTLLDDAIAEGDEDFGITLSNPTGATLGRATADVTIVDDEASPCGQPAYDAATEAAIFVWKDCATGQWHGRATAGGGFVTYQGSIASSAPFAQMLGYSIEASDTFDSSDPAATVFALSVSSAGQDGVDFEPATGAITCFTVDAPAGVSVYVGAARTPVVASFDLNTLGACGTLPALTITDVAVGEAAGSAVFTLSLSAPAAGEVTADFTTLDGTATAGTDYVAQAGAISIPAGTLSTTVAVTIVDDGAIEGSEAFSLELANPAGATLARASGAATITDNDSASFSVDSVSAVETDGSMTFTVTLSTAELVAVSVDYATSDVSATAGLDYEAAASTTLTFAPGEVSKQIVVNLLDDALVEGDETFNVTLSNAVGAGIATAVGIGTITDSEPLPVITVTDASAQESAGVLTFDLALSAASTQPVSVDYETLAGSATAGADYVAQAPTTLVIQPGEVSATIDIPLIDDTDIESDETFGLQLSNPVRATLATASATATINDDEGLPTLSISDVTASETQGLMTFTANLSAASTLAVSVDYATLDGSATAGQDYVLETGTLTFAPGVTSQTISVTLLDDAELEFDETFSIALSNPVEVNLAATAVTATIADDEAFICGAPTYDPATESVIAVWQDCATTGQWHVRMTAGAAGGFREYPGNVVSNQGFVSVTGFSLESGDFLDYTTNPTTMSFTLGMTPPGSDGLDFYTSPDATLCFNVNVPSGTQLIAGAGRTPVATSSFDLRTLGVCEVLPVASLSGVSVVENDPVASFAVSLSAPASTPVTIDYQTFDGSATGGQDYAAMSGTLTFDPGETDKTIDVPLLDDADFEPVEDFGLQLAHAVNASLGTGNVSVTASATITDDEITPTFSVSDTSVSESAGSVNVTVSLQQAAANTVSVDVVSVAGSATDGADYTGFPVTTLTFDPGDVARSLVLPVLDDVLAEGPETLDIQLSNPVGGVIAAGTAVYTIDDDEPSPCGEPVYDVATEAGLFIWKDCASGVWSARYTGGPSYRVYRGTVVSDAALAAVTGVDLEVTDVYDFATDPAILAYSELRVGASNVDGFDFSLAPGATACVTIDEPAGTSVYVGAARTPVVAPFDLATLAACN